MGLEGYTGPTSGRITVGGNEPSRVERFYDEPLTKEEKEATAEFAELGPIAQLRKVAEMETELKRLRWNESVLRKETETFRKHWGDWHREEIRLRAEISRRPPEGYSRPKIVRELMEHAEACGWTARAAWDEPGEYPEVHVQIGLRLETPEGLWEVKLTWYCTPGGKGRRVRSGLIRQPYRGWSDAPSVAKLKEIISTASEVV